MKLIDADGLLAGIYSDRPQDIMQYIADEPEAIVRCKDCKYNEPTEMCDETPEVGYCKELETVVEDNGFCSFGQRMEKE